MKDKAERVNVELATALHQGLQPIRRVWARQHGFAVRSDDRVYRVIDPQAWRSPEGYNVFDSGPIYELNGMIYIIKDARGHRV